MGRNPELCQFDQTVMISTNQQPSGSEVVKTDIDILRQSGAPWCDFDPDIHLIA
jgi:hypothetical protein